MIVVYNSCRIVDRSLLVVFIEKRNVDISRRRNESNINNSYEYKNNLRPA